VGKGGGMVIGCDCVFVTLATVVDDFWEGSLQPNHPGVSHVAVELEGIFVAVG